jgi:hypothetical protein
MALEKPFNSGRSKSQLKKLTKVKTGTKAKGKTRGAGK